MPPRLSVFTENYVGKARPKQAEYDDPLRDRQPAEGEVRFCYTCNKQFKIGDAIVITKLRHGPQRRHALCAVRKNILTRSEAKALLEQVFADMKFEIPDAIQKLARDSI